MNPLLKDDFKCLPLVKSVSITLGLEGNYNFKIKATDYLLLIKCLYSVIDKLLSMNIYSTCRLNIKGEQVNRLHKKAGHSL